MATRAAAAIRSLPGGALAHLDALRALAALAVLVGHVRSLFFVDLPEVTRPSLVVRAIYFATGFGHLAVMVFFVLSGFFVGTSVLTSAGAGAFSWRRFLLRRLTRLYVVLVPALLLTALLDAVGLRLFGAGAVYGGNLDAPFLRVFDVRASLGATTFAGNLAFLQYIVVEPFGGNTPLWSLAYELWYYVAFPCLVLALARGVRAPLRAAYLAALLLLAAVGGQLAFGFTVWLLGAAVAAGWRRVPWAIGRAGVAVAAVLFGGALVAARAQALGSSRAEDFAVGAGAALFVAALVASGGRGDAPPRATYARAAARWAGFSYTLYLVHFPMLLFVNAPLVHVVRWQPTAPRLAFACALTLAVLAVAFGFSRVTEARTDAVRARLHRWTGSAAS